MDIQKLEAGDTFNLCPIDADGGVYAALGLSKVDNVLVLREVVDSAPRCQVLNLHPVGWLTVAIGEANHCWVVCKLEHVQAHTLGESTICLGIF